MAKYLYFILFFPFSVYSQLYITEVLPSSTSSKVGPEYLFSDYVEIYNYTDSTVSLKGYSISDGEATLFFNVSLKLKPKSFMVFKGSDKPNPGLYELNFKLNKSGESLKLYNASNKVIDKLTFPRLEVNHSYGRISDTLKKCGIFTKLSPGKTNGDIAYKSYAKRSVKLSKGSSYFDDEITLSLKKPFLGKYNLFYTKDGSNVSNDTLINSYSFKNSYQENPWDGPRSELKNQVFSSKLYKNKLSLNLINFNANSASQKSSTFNVNPKYIPNYNIPKAHVISAAAAKSNKLQKNTEYATYFKTGTLKNPKDFLLSSVIVPEEDLFDYYTGIYTAGLSFDNFRKSSSEPTGLCTKGNFRLTGSEYKRPAYIDIFNDKSVIFSSKVDLSINGGCTRSFPYKALRFETQNEFSLDTFFGNESSKADRLVFRNSGNDFDETMFKDVFVAEWMRPLAFPTQEYKPNILYINGEYWGIQELREKVDQRFVGRKYDLDPEKIDLIKIRFDASEETEAGSDSAYQILKKYFKTTDFSKPENYSKALELIDLQNFMDYQAAQIFIGNIDWPQNNVRLWRKNDNLGKNENDGRWRFIFYDADRGLGEVVNEYHDNLGEALQKADNFIFSALYKNPTFKTAFATRFRELMSTIFDPKVSVPLFLKFKEMYKPEVEEHLKRWKNIPNLTAWDNNCMQVKNYLENRPNLLKNQLSYYFGSGNFVEVAQKGLKEGEEGVFLIYESGPKMPLKTNGVWKSENQDLILQAQAPAGYDFDAWQTTSGLVYDKQLLIDSDSSHSVIAMFKKIDSSPKVKISQGVSLNHDGQNESISLRLLEPNLEIDQFLVYDRLGRTVPLLSIKTAENEFNFNLKNSVQAGTYFYYLKFKTNLQPLEGFIEIRN